MVEKESKPEGEEEKSKESQTLRREEKKNQVWNVFVSQLLRNYDSSSERTAGVV